MYRDVRIYLLLLDGAEVLNMKINNEILQIYKLIHWNSTAEMQEKGIKMAEKVEDLSYFMQPLVSEYTKSVWDNCAIIISKRSDEELKPYLKQMLSWLKDMNWPGAFEIKDRLVKVSAPILIPEYLNCISSAIKDGKKTWLMFLSGLIDNKELYNLLPEDKKELMMEKYKMFWGYSGE